MRILIALVVVLGTAGACKKKEGGEAAGGGNPCDAAVANGVDKTISKRRAGNTQPMTPAEEEVPKKLKVALAKSCVDDKWSPEVIDCFKTADDIASCKEKLTPEQRAAYSRAAMGVMASSGAGGRMPPHGMGGTPPAPPSEGSGSAASGSASPEPAPGGSD